MTADLPQIVLGFGTDSEYVVMVGAEETEAATPTALMALAPALKQPEAALETARAINFLSQGSAFRLIEDPAVFEEQYRAKLASEDPNAPWAEGVVRLSDYGVPDFAEITAPVISASRLTFFAVDDFLGLPYRVEVDLTGAEVNVTDENYKPLDLTPLDIGDEPEMPTPINADEHPLARMMRTKGPDD
jgi:hypothetical protein